MTHMAQHGPAARLGHVALALLLLLSAMASGQSRPDRETTWYVGSVKQAGVARQPMLLDLTLFDDGFAFGRLQLPGSGEVLLGSGWLRESVELRLNLDRLSPGEDPWWAAELAHLAATSPDAAPPDEPRETVAVLKADRDMDFANEGTTLAGLLRWSTGEPAELELHRYASEATWSFEQGRVSSTVVLPHFTYLTSLGFLLERETMAQWRDFIGEGRLLDEEGVLGWGWYREERVKPVGAAGEYVSLLATVENYTGGAHPNTFHGSYLLRVEQGDVEMLELRDVFDEDTEAWLPFLSDLVLAGLAAQEAAWVKDDQVVTLTEDDLSVFTFDAAGMTFHFSPYLMGPYVQGTFRVKVPYAELEGLAGAGPLSAFAAGEAPLLRDTSAGADGSL